MLPPALPCKYLSGLEEVEADLDRHVDNSIAPTLILLDATTNLDLIAPCRVLCQRKLAHDLPIIVIIARLEDRQPALAAGVDDYLLLPLVPEEFQRRLGLH